MDDYDPSKRLAMYRLKKIEGARMDIVLEYKQAATLDETTFGAHCARLRPSGLRELKEWIGVPADVRVGKGRERQRKGEQRPIKGEQRPGQGEQPRFIQPPPAHLKPGMVLSNCSPDDRALLANAARQMVYRPLAQLHPEFIELAEAWFKQIGPPVLIAAARDIYISAGAELTITQSVHLVSARGVYIEPGGQITKRGGDLRLVCEIFSNVARPLLPIRRSP